MDIVRGARRRVDCCVAVLAREVDTRNEEGRTNSSRKRDLMVDDVEARERKGLVSRDS